MPDGKRNQGEPTAFFAQRMRPRRSAADVSDREAWGRRRSPRFNEAAVVCRGYRMGALVQLLFQPTLQ